MNILWPHEILVSWPAAKVERFLGGPTRERRYHYRLDWLMWFAAFSQYQRHPWLLQPRASLLFCTVIGCY